MIIGFIFFILVALAILFLAHWLIYLTLVRFLTIANPELQKYLLFLLAILGISFILASLLAHWSDNALTRGSYYLASVWLGILVNFFLAAVGVWLIFWLAKLFGFNLNPAVLAVVFFTGAILISLWGLWNVAHPRLVSVTVPIENLPADWRGKKIVQISDAHLGHINREKFIQKIIDLVNVADPQIVVITGDLFDGMDGELNSFIEPLRQLKAPDGILFVTGNHENYLGAEKALATFGPEQKIQVLNDELLNIRGLQFLGFSFPREEFNQKVAEKFQALPEFDRTRPSVFLYHAPSGIEAAAANNVSLQLSGHTHRGQLFPFQWITQLLFKGYDYGLKKLDNTFIYTTSGVGTWGPPMRTNSRSEVVVITLK